MSANLQFWICRYYRPLFVPGTILHILAVYFQGQTHFLPNILQFPEPLIAWGARFERLPFDLAVCHHVVSYTWRFLVE